MEIIIGENGIGKTLYLENEKNKDEKAIIISSEIIFKDEVENEKRLINSKNLISDLIDSVINELVNIETETNITEQFMDTEYYSDLKLIEEKFSEMKINGIKVFNEIDLNKSITFSFLSSLLSRNKQKIIEGLSTGQSSIAIYKFIKDFFININSIEFLKTSINEFNIYLDEPDNFLHIGLIYELSEILKELEEINFIKIKVVTHNAILASLLCEYYFSNLFTIKNNQKFAIFDYSATKEMYEKINLIKVEESNKNAFPSLSKHKKWFKFSPLHKKEIIESIFTDVLFVVEDMAHKILLEKILIINEFKNKDYQILIMNGKSAIPLYLSSLKIKKKIIVIYDDDCKDGNCFSHHDEINKLIEEFDEGILKIKTTPNFVSEITNNEIIEQSHKQYSAELIDYNLSKEQTIKYFEKIINYINDF